METSKQLFAKIVATPTDTSWSQAYNAGGLYAVLSLHIMSSQKAEDLDLHITGKQIIDTLEQEFFTLEEKNLATIKKAVELACQKIPSEISASFCVISIPQGPIIKGDHIMYAFLLGKGGIILKRHDKVGAILKNTEELTASSGFLQDKDLIVLATSQFTSIIPKDELFATIDSMTPDDIAETFAPKIHEKEEGGACAIFVSFQKPTSDAEQPLEEASEAQNIQEVEEEIQQPEQPMAQPIRMREDTAIRNTSQRFPKIPLHVELTHKKKLFLTIAVVILAVFISSIYFTIKKKADQKTHELFQSVIDPAQKKFDEGNAIAPLNTSLALDDYQQAKDILSPAITKFPKGSSEQTEASALLKKITDALKSAGNVNDVQTKSVDANSSPLLTTEIKNSSSYFTQDDKAIYLATQANISSVDKTSQKQTVLVKNTSTWSDIGGLGTYLGNLYLLDKQSNQIYKFIANDSGFSTTSYLGGSSTQDFSKAVSLTVDTSIWVLLQDGTILRFTRGNLDPVTVSGLDKKLVNPTKIFTNTDTNNVYILDIGNKRIVVLSKTGAYQAQYQADIIKSAKDFDVFEKDKKILILADNKIHEIAIK